MFDIDGDPTDMAASDPIAVMRAGLAKLAAEDRDGWPAAMQSERLVELLQLKDRVDAAVIRATAEWKRQRAWEVDGSLSPVAWLTHRAPVGASQARRLVKAARITHDAPQLGAALAEAKTTAAHVNALAAVISDRRRPLLAEHEEVLAQQSQELSIREYTLLVRRWAAMADDVLATELRDEHVPCNVLFASTTMDGRVVGNFDLEAIAGAELLKGLDHLAPPDSADAPDGVRSLSQRRGDALADLAHWYQQGATPGANPPNLDVVVDVATLNGETPELARVRCEVEGVGPVTRATLERIACGATLRRLVMAGNSLILDMGRKTRFATPAQARAVRIRDGGCVFASRDRPAPWCDIHHVDEWVHLGETNVPTLACLCARHHTLVHNSRWTIKRNPDGTFTTTHPIRAP